MKNTLVRSSVLFGLLVSLATFAADFPTGPDPVLTPGSLCSKPTAYRYPERIPYCNRNVGTDLKNEVIKTYDNTLGFRVGSMNRKDFKIDHYIPLCMGGSNQSDNLWPQHESVFVVTDRLEQESCLKMAAGKLLQKDAIEIIKKAKANLKDASLLLKQVMEL